MSFRDRFDMVFLAICLAVIVGCITLSFAQDIPDESQQVASVVMMGGGTPAGGPDYTADGNCQGAWLFADNLLDSAAGSAGVNDLTGTGDIVYSTTRPGTFTFGKSIDFSGTANYVSRAFADLSVNFPGGVTKTNWAFAIWINPDQITAVNYFFSATQTAPFYEEFDGKIKGWQSDSDPTTAYFTLYNSAMSVGTWYHLVYSFAGADPTGTATCWVSTTSFGNLVNAASIVETNVKNIGGGSLPFAVGANSEGAAPFNGKIYQPIIFDRTLSAAEAQNLYTTGINGAH